MSTPAAGAEQAAGEATAGQSDAAVGLKPPQVQRSEPSAASCTVRCSAPHVSSASRPSAAQLKQLLDSEGGNVCALSRRLQVCSKTIYRWLRTYRIDLMGIRAAELV